jgi:hypothetical protein
MTITAGNIKRIKSEQLSKSIESKKKTLSNDKKINKES